MPRSLVAHGRRPPLAWRSPNQRRIVAAAAGPSYDTDAQAYFTAVEGAGGTINTAGKDAYDDFVVALKGYGLWTIIGRLPCWNGQDAFAALRDLKDPSVTYTAVNSPTHTPKTGYDFNGTTQYIASGVIPSSAGLFTQDNVHLSVWILDNVQATAQHDIGGGDGTRNIRLTSRNGADTLTCGTNSSSGAINVGAAASSVAHAIVTRTASNLSSGYRDGASTGTTSALTSNGLPTVEFYFGANNNNGTPASFSTRAQALASVGTAMDATQAGNFYTAAAAFVAAMSAS